ncbi:Acyl-CoA dehydrogenase-related protein [Pseudomonas cichorii]|uniref:Acyl-CoA dehydrogenase-related protein n=1 Tax=Pseudomonas cichorii TaxID=36746 RepID=A0A3M4M2A5_PSECI|nr:acyl-CoA dehydrogenase family protein [Pseudomonas cichorii]RMQ47750.1 Acyl-CoA dehydrogenase-related protein [Pseudomonas cichorii]
MTQALKEFLDWRRHGYADTQALGECLRALVDESLDRLPLPASGRTLERWQALACVAAHDLGLCKLYEGHTDALAIMQELAAEPPAPGTTWGMWAAEPPNARVNISGQADSLRLNGRKAWCSGAAVLSHALITAWDEENRQQLVAVALDQPGIHVITNGWRAVGMGATGSIEVQFDQASATLVGPPGGYLSRAGFWHGGIGIAVCWYGASRALAQRLVQHAGKGEEPHALAHLGAVDVALYGSGQILQNAASRLDQAPHDDAEQLARRCRAHVEQTAEQVISHVGRAMGATPYCKDAHFARLITDLPVFLRQSHAEKDLAVLGKLIGQTSTSPLDTVWQP